MVMVVVTFYHATVVACTQVPTGAEAKHLHHIVLPANIIQTHLGMGGAYGMALSWVELLF
jgi:hypothetical protein